MQEGLGWSSCECTREIPGLDSAGGWPQSNHLTAHEERKAEAIDESHDTNSVPRACLCDQHVAALNGFVGLPPPIGGRNLMRTLVPPAVPSYRRCL